VAPINPSKIIWIYFGRMRVPTTANCRAAVLVLPALLILAGCAVGPNYNAPKPVMPATFSEASLSVISSNSVIAGTNEDWWLVLKDPTLDDLMQEAIHSAPDLAEADARLREVRAQRGIVTADQLPVFNANANYDRTHGSENVPVGVPPGGLGPGEDSDLWQAGFDSSWEIDVFGGVRRKVESANASYQAAIEDRRDVVLSLLAEVARNYVELRCEQQQLKIIQNSLSIQKDVLALTQSSFAAGLRSSRDVSDAKAQFYATESQIPILVADEHASIYRIGVLIGRRPEDMFSELVEPKLTQIIIPNVPVGLPSDLLRRRPDIRAAERRLAAANAEIGAAKADLYPHFYLTGIAGLESLNLGSFGNIASGYYSVGPEITWKIFDAGKVRAKVLGERARTDLAAAVYQQTVLAALQEVETSLSSYGQQQIRRNSIVEEMAAEQHSLRLSRQLYNHGVEDFFSVLDAERVLNNSEFELTASDRDTALALISLYKSLGGGWETADLTTNAANREATHKLNNLQAGSGVRSDLVPAVNAMNN
jgi:outer membrane protein, multidrug efflux system